MKLSCLKLAHFHFAEDIYINILRGGQECARAGENWRVDGSCCHPLSLL